MRNIANCVCVCVCVCVSVCVCLLGTQLRPFLATASPIKQKRAAPLSSLLFQSHVRRISLFLCVCVSTPTRACNVFVSLTFFSLLQYVALLPTSSSSSSSSSSPLLSLLWPGCTLPSEPLSWVFSLFIISILPTLSSSRKKQKNKKQKAR